MVRALLLDKKNQYSAPAPSPTPAPIKAVEPNCVTCGGSGTLPGDTITNPKEDLKGMDECFVLTDLGASINLMPLFVWKADFVVVDFEPDSRVPLILGRCFLKIGRALIDVHKGKLTLRIRNEAITYNLDQTSRYSANFDQITANKIDVTDEACEEYSQEVLGFFDVTVSSSPTPSDDPIVSTTSPTLTPFEDSDFLLFEEADAFLGLEDDLDSPEFDPSYYDSEGDILLLKAILNSEPLPPLPNHEQSVTSFKEELKACEAKTIKSLVDEPPEVELKKLPPHLEYAFLEGENKLPVIIAKELGDEEKSALIKGGFTVVKNEENELIPTRLVTGWRVCIDYQKLNEATRKDHFPLPFMDQMLERLAGNEYYCFLDGFSGFFQIPIDPRDQEKTTFTCPYATFAYRRMPFDLCNAPGTFQRIEVNKAKVDVITKLPHPTTIKGVRSFLGHAGFYRRFIKDFSKISQPMTHLLDKDTPFIFSEDCIKAFQTLKKKLMKAPILIAPNWDLPFELMCDASDFAIGAVLGQRYEKHFRPIHYASKTLTEAESNYTTKKKEMIVDAKARLLQWVLLLQEFDFDVIDTKGAENLAADHLTLEMYRASNLKSIKALDKELEEVKLKKDALDGKLARLLKASKNIDHLIESQRSDQVKEGVGYNAVPPHAADLYLSPKKDLSWTGLPEFVDDTVTDYSRPSPTVASTSAEGSEFVLHKKPCFNCGDFSHLANDCRRRVQREITRSQKYAYESPSHKFVGHRPHGAPLRPPHRPHGPPMKPMRPNMNGARPNRTTFNKQAHPYANRSFQRTSAVRPQYRAPWVPTVNRNFPLPKAVINRRNRVKDVQASACWVGKPVKPNSASIILKRYDYVDVRGRSRSTKIQFRSIFVVSHIITLQRLLSVLIILEDLYLRIFNKNCLSRLDKMLQRCEYTKLCLNWEKSHFMVKEGIVLGHKISKNRIEVDKAKIDVITKLPHPTTVKVHTDHSALKYFFAKKDVKARLLRCVLLLQEFDFDVIDTKGAENIASDHLSRLETRMKT
nr:DNA-directed DNA polymerase [Tanacetum cinerariifolium]